ncbi:MAG TPA: site-specific integrase [Polyangiaceae bacterium]|nr:site-specific integrase [Polyangiaceae bacterium]
MGRLTLKRRKDQAWTLTRKSEEQIWYARFTVAGCVTERSTGSRDDDEADAEAAKLVANARAGELRKDSRAKRRGGATPLKELVTAWLLWLTTTHADKTRKVWEEYGRTHFIPFFGSTEKLTESGCAEYRRVRLGKVLASTVRHELTALRNFVSFCALPDVGGIPEVFAISGVPKRVTGKAHSVRRRTAADPISPEDTLKIIALLPAWGGRRGPERKDMDRKRSYKVNLFPIRARFVFAYETGLRPSTIDRLSVPEHYTKGADVLRITPEIDKSRWGRDVPLTEKARKALDSICPKEGLIFGWHDYRSHIKAAAKQVLKGEAAKRFAGSHLRSAMTTHELEQGKNIIGIQYRVGHKLLSTTSRYVKPSFRAALETVASVPAQAPENQNLGVPQKKTPKRKTA